MKVYSGRRAKVPLILQDDVRWRDGLIGSIPQPLNLFTSVAPYSVLTWRRKQESLPARKTTPGAQILYRRFTVWATALIATSY